jgi:hypothetical protein
MSVIGAGEKKLRRPLVLRCPVALSLHVGLGPGPRIQTSEVLPDTGHLIRKGNNQDIGTKVVRLTQAFGFFCLAVNVFPFSILL